MTMRRVVRAVLAAGVFLSTHFILPDCFDNRFLSLYPRQLLRTVDKNSHFSAEGFFLTGDSAHGDASKKKKGIPELWGSFDQRVLTDASVAAGNSNRLRPAWQGEDIPWNLHGKIQGQGFQISAEYGMTQHFSLGVTTAFMHLSSNQKFVLPRDTARTLALTSSDEEELDRNRRDTLEDLGFVVGKWSHSGMTDTKLYARYGWKKDYVFKCRQVSGGMNVGAFIPSADQRDTVNPASIPFGGENMAGFFCGVDAAFELREDMWFSFLFDLSKRFKKTQTRRIPLRGEPEIFGATSGKVEVDPGISFIVSPKVTLADIRDGFGLGLQYVFAYHARDVWQDKRDDKTLAIDISNISKLSKWDSEYLLFNVFYDSGRVNPERRLHPIVSFSWDIPANIFATTDRAKTQRVGLSVEFLF